MIKSITLNNPCHENWDVMNPAREGKFCLSCQKNVVDFNGMNIEEILGFIAGKQNICGRIGYQQLNEINHHLDIQNMKPESRWKRWLMTIAFFGSTLFYKANGQPHPGAVTAIEQTTPKNYLNNSQSGMVAVRRPFEREIKGQILDDDCKPLHGATIRVVGTELAIATDTDGFFRLHTPASGKQFTVSFVGFEPETVDIDSGYHNGYTVVLSPRMIALNDVVVVKGYAAQRHTGLLGSITVVDASTIKRHSWWWRIYHQYIVRPIRSIFEPKKHIK